MTSPALSRILMVEDEADIQTVAQLALEAVGGFLVHISSCGSEALSAAADFAPDLILLDVMMPDMDGPSTLKALRANARTSHIPIIFMTAKIQAHEIAHYKALGALDVIAKPFDPMALSATVSTIWNQHHGTG